MEVDFSDGVYRLARPTNMKAGDHCYGCRCHGCGLMMPLLADVSNGTVKLDFIGSGKLSVPCHSCFTDELYELTELVPFIAPHRVGPARLTPSGVYRRKLTDAYPGVKVTFGVGFLEDRPEMAAAVGRIVGLWAEVEAACANLVTNFLGARSGPAVAMFLAIRSSRPQFEAMTAAAKAVLGERDMLLFNALMHIREGLERERNQLAHGHYGGAPAISRGIVWISVVDRSEFHLRAWPSNSTLDDRLVWMRERSFVYEPEDAETLAQQIESLASAISQFSAYLRLPEGDRRDERYNELCEWPRVPEALAHLGGRKKPQSAPRKQRNRAAPP